MIQLRDQMYTNLNIHKLQFQFDQKYNFKIYHIMRCMFLADILIIKWVEDNLTIKIYF